MVVRKSCLVAFLVMMQRPRLHSDDDVQSFLELLFARGQIYKSSFDSICNAGCNRESLGSLLYGLGWTTTHAKLSRLRLSEVHPFSKKELDRLQSDLEDLAKRIERLDSHFTAPRKFAIDLCESELQRTGQPQDREDNLPESSYTTTLKDSLEGLRKDQAARADRMAILPRALRDYAAHLGQLRNDKRRFGKNRTLPHLQLWILLGEIEQGTGRPHYEEVSTLVTGGFLVFGGSETRIPKAFSAEALAKLKRRISADNKMKH